MLVPLRDPHSQSPASKAVEYDNPAGGREDKENQQLANSTDSLALSIVSKSPDPPPSTKSVTAPDAIVAVPSSANRPTTPPSGYALKPSQQRSSKSPRERLQELLPIENFHSESFSMLQYESPNPKSRTHTPVRTPTTPPPAALMDKKQAEERTAASQSHEIVPASHRTPPKGKSREDRANFFPLANADALALHDAKGGEHMQSLAEQPFVTPVAEFFPGTPLLEVADMDPERKQLMDGSVPSGLMELQDAGETGRASARESLMKIADRSNSPRSVRALKDGKTNEVPNTVSPYALCPSSATPPSPTYCHAGIPPPPSRTLKAPDHLVNILACRRSSTRTTTPPPTHPLALTAYTPPRNSPPDALVCRPTTPRATVDARESDEEGTECQLALPAGAVLSTTPLATPRSERETASKRQRMSPIATPPLPSLTDCEMSLSLPLANTADETDGAIVPALSPAFSPSPPHALPLEDDRDMETALQPYEDHETAEADRDGGLAAIEDFGAPPVSSLVPLSSSGSPCEPEKEKKRASLQMFAFPDISPDGTPESQNREPRKEADGEAGQQFFALRDLSPANFRQNDQQKDESPLKALHDRSPPSAVRLHRGEAPSAKNPSPRVSEETSSKQSSTPESDKQAERKVKVGSDISSENKTEAEGEGESTDRGGKEGADGMPPQAFVAGTPLKSLQSARLRKLLNTGKKGAAVPPAPPLPRRLQQAHTQQQEGTEKDQSATKGPEGREREDKSPRKSNTSTMTSGGKGLKVPLAGGQRTRLPAGPRLAGGPSPFGSLTPAAKPAGKEKDKGGVSPVRRFVSSGAACGQMSAKVQRILKNQNNGGAKKGADSEGPPPSTETTEGAKGSSAEEQNALCKELLAIASESLEATEAIAVQAERLELEVSRLDEEKRTLAEKKAEQMKLIDSSQKREREMAEMIKMLRDEKETVRQKFKTFHGDAALKLSAAEKKVDEATRAKGAAEQDAKEALARAVAAEEAVVSRDSLLAAREEALSRLSEEREEILLKLKERESEIQTLEDKKLELVEQNGQLQSEHLQLVRLLEEQKKKCEGQAKDAGRESLPSLAHSPAGSVSARTPTPRLQQKAQRSTGEEEEETERQQDKERLEEELRALREEADTLRNERRADAEKILTLESDQQELIQYVQQLQASLGVEAEEGEGEGEKAAGDDNDSEEFADAREEDGE
uniref:Uncharacterized protein n=1 Tax=Chromera velia CCMP2878 TaxID=1169474 RepID=A0A0G4F1W4_9ALVE|eukprot:Cvel_14666.t1-p1 / transcript=Cvel_14666.t1 / gene=Cvel_14666 / organism=Chromera_velia_CCMP2878 / gene_product=hypothetical protein / transcript_product=hypothetical protein / location=Cvel_scaffold1051:30510-38760(+) / protein_length=1193 / sequence_SO=supercontig / SO=protein_coding / is_pseudo=false